MSFTFTITIHPLRWLRNMLVLTLFMACVAVPVSVGNEPKHRALPSRETVAKHTAYSTVDAYLDRRMPEFPSEKRRELAQTIVNESIEGGFDPLFVLAVIDAESSFDAEAVSAVLDTNGNPKANARGLMQIIPSTWEHECKRRGLGKLNKFNPVDNVRVGIGYLAYLGKGFKRLDSLLLAYNQGPGRASSILKKEEEPSIEGAIYGPIVLAKYKTILVHHGFNPRDARKLFRSPTSTVLNADYAAPVSGTMVATR